MNPPLRLEWTRRTAPLPPAGAVAAGPAGTALHAAAARRAGEGADVRAAAGDGWVVVLAAETDLPWVDGVQYVGWDGGMLVPCTLAPGSRVALVAAAVRRRAEADSGDVIVLLRDRVLAFPPPQRRIPSGPPQPLPSSTPAT